MKLLYCFLVAIILCSTAKANTITYVTQTGSGAKDGSDWNNAMDATQLKPALDVASAGTDFWIAAGTYYPGDGSTNRVWFKLNSGVGLYGGFAGNESMLNERNISMNATILSGDLNKDNQGDDGDAFHVIYSDQAVNVIVDGFTITRGHVNYTNGDVDTYGGGGIYFNTTEVNATIRNCNITNNYASTFGGGVGILIGGNITIEDCNFTYNGPGSFGSAIYSMAASNIRNCIFSNNYYGGVVSVRGGYYSSYITNCTIVNNNAYSGAPILVNTMYLYVTNTIVWNNIIYPNSRIVGVPIGNYTPPAVVNNCIVQKAWDGQGANNITADPLFSNSNFEISSCSPAVNAGTNTDAPLTDYAGNVRPYDNTTDIGAYEYQGTAGQVTPTISISGPDALCRHSLATYTATYTHGGSTPVFQWKVNGVNSGTNSPVFSSDTFSTDAIITCDITSNDFCAAVTQVTSNNIPLHVVQLPVIDKSIDTGFCVTGSVTLSAKDTYYGYSWSTGETTPSITVNAFGTYMLTASTEGCTNTDSVHVINNKADLHPAAAPASICEGESAQLNAGNTGAASQVYSWQPGNAGTESITVSPASTTTYTVTANHNGCIATADVQVTVKVRPVISTTDALTNLCQTASVTLNSSYVNNNVWSNGETTQSVTVHNAGTYNVSADGCSSTSPVTITYKPLPTIAVNGPATICPGFSVNISASNGNSYLWSTGETSQSITVNSENNYSVAVTDATGCTQTVYQQVNVKPLDKPETINSTGLDLCTYGYGYADIYVNNYMDGLTYSINGDSVSNLGYGYFVAWKGGNYQVTATDALGCNSQPSDPITFNAAPGNTDEFGNQIWNVYAFNRGYNNGLNPENPWQRYGHYDDGNYAYGADNYSGYYVENNLSFDTRNTWNENSKPSDATNFQGCEMPAPYYYAWSAKRKGFPCGNYSISIPAHNDDAQLFINGVMVWQETGTNDNSQTVWQGVLGTDTKVEFRVAEQDYYKCYGAISFNLIDNNVVTKPTITPSGSISVCSNASATLTSSAATGNVWSNNATTQSITVNTAGNYYVTVAGSEGCTAQSDAVNVTVTQAATWYHDGDHDSYGDATNSIQSCSQPANYVSNHTDCDDNNAAIYPGAAEICDGLDNNCNGQVDEGCGVLISIKDKSLKEGNGSGTKTMSFVVKLSKKSNNTVKVDYTTQNIDAVAGTDYTAQPGTLTFAPGQKKKAIKITIQKDNTVETDEQFKVQLSNPVKAGILDGDAIGTIMNDDQANNFVQRNTETPANTTQQVSINLSPNPATNYVYVQLTGYTGNVTIQFSNMQGKVLQQKKAGTTSKNAQQQINISSYPAGIYFITVTDEHGKRKTEKLVIER